MPLPTDYPTWLSHPEHGRRLFQTEADVVRAEVETPGWMHHVIGAIGAEGAQAVSAQASKKRGRHKLTGGPVQRLPLENARTDSGENDLPADPALADTDPFGD